MGVSKDCSNFLLLVVALSFESESKLQTKIIMSAYVVRQWLFIDIETDDFGRIDFWKIWLRACDAHIEALACVRSFRYAMLCYANYLLI